ncbi:hypothetical protein N9937_02360 [bacterium]|nr:hypothetical protein [bacterium]
MKGNPEDLFEPKLPPINLYAMAPAWIFEENRMKSIQQGIIDYHMGEMVEIPAEVIDALVEAYKCSHSDIYCYVHPSIGEEVVIVRGIFAGYLQQWEEEYVI